LGVLEVLGRLNHLSQDHDNDCSAFALEKAGVKKKA
jgi:hypothetical protein